MHGSHVTDVQRDRAVDYLQRAFASGVIDSESFEDRVATALTASTRAELNSSLRGIARVVDPSHHSDVAPMARPPVVDSAQNVGAGFTHLSGYIFPFFLGPVIVKAVARPGSRLWLEAGRALSFQLTAISVALALGMVMALLNVGESLFFFGVIGWLVTTSVLAIRAFQGQNSTAAFEKVLLFRPPQQRNRQIGE